MKYFCSKAFNGISVTPSGACAPCCLFERIIQKEDGSQFKIWEDQVEDIFNSKYMKDIRRRMIAGEPIEACRQCYQVESHGGYSLRHMSNQTEQVPKEDISASKNLMPVFIDLKLNNRCNLKCRMCQPRDSHLIYSEFKNIAAKDPTFTRFTNTHLNDPDLQIPLEDIPEWSTSPAFMDQFGKMVNHIRKISIVGGEPLILNEVYDLMDLLIEKGVSKNIYLAFTTNLVHLPAERLKKLLPHFEKTLFNISLDAVDEELYYLRYPTKFEKVKDNFRTIIEEFGDSRLILQFSPTVQVYNVLTLDKVYRFVEGLLKDGFQLSMNPVNLTFLEFPMHLNIRILPSSVREVAIERLEKLKAEIPLLLNCVQVRDNLNQLIHILKHEHITNHDYVPEFLYYSELLDKERGQKGTEAFPDLFRLLKDVKPNPPIESYHQTRERGWRLAHEGKLQEAIAEFEVALETSMNKDLDYREIAWMKNSLGDPSEALRLFQLSFSLNPSDMHSSKGIAIQLGILGQQEELKKILPRALELNPDDKDLLALNEQLQRNQT